MPLLWSFTTLQDRNFYKHVAPPGLLSIVTLHSEIPLIQQQCALPLAANLIMKPLEVGLRLHFS
jgi:hypothetical protein